MDGSAVRIRWFDVSFYFTAIHCPVLLKPSRRIRLSPARCFRYCCTLWGIPNCDREVLLVYLFQTKIILNSSFSASVRPFI